MFDIAVEMYLMKSPACIEPFEALLISPMLTCSSDLSLLCAVVAGPLFIFFFFFRVRFGEGFFAVAKMLLGFFVGPLGFSGRSHCFSISMDLAS